jgi:hypothetical protein
MALAFDYKCPTRHQGPLSGGERRCPTVSEEHGAAKPMRDRAAPSDAKSHS